MADETSAYEAGRGAGEAGEDRKNPFDGRSTEGKDWYRGYDSVPKPEPVVLASAGASTDPDVQFLIANRRSHEIILAGNPDQHNKAHAEQSIAEIDERLREMGYR